MTSTIVSFHAHPDDEAITVGGTLAMAADAGHRVVLVFATRGDLGEVADGVLAPDEALGERREQEARAAADVLGAARVAFLPYHDSGMAGEPTNDAPEAFAAADVEEAAARLADLLREEDADVLTVYDERGNYGHPDHIQVHRVGVRAAELAGVEKVYENTVDRDYFVDLIQRAAEFGVEMPDDTPDEEFELGVSGDLITTIVDVRDKLEVKKAAMRAHASQIAETSFFLAMPDKAFEAMWGQEWYILRGAPKGTKETDLFGGL